MEEVKTKEWESVKSKTKEVGIIGARSLGFEHATLVAQVIQTLLKKGYNLSTGGAIGADQFCIEALLKNGHSNRCMAYVPWYGYKGFPIKVRAMMKQYKSYGGRITWGPISSYKKAHPSVVKLALLNRNVQLVQACFGVVAFINASSRGTIFTLKKAAQKRKRIVVFPFDCELPVISNVKWVPLRCASCWKGGFKVVYLK